MTGVHRSSLATIAAVTVTAYALCDLVHEVLGHALAALLVPGVRIVSLSTVALQTTGSSRTVAAAGTIANLVAGAVALAAFHGRTRLSPSAYFLWLFGALNLLNGSGYPLYSAILGSGDWAAVVRGLQPAVMWRVALAIIGVGTYAAVVVLSANALARAVEKELVALPDVPRLAFPAYIIGGAFLLLASAFNPISPTLILTSGLASGFGAMAGLTAIPAIVERRVSGDQKGGAVISPSTGWVATGLVVGVMFVGVVGPGIRF
ncbi:MAG TPA: hypothetical protein VER58_09365 [Thermoanaerobaculia bacterium]|nr:hypothetical protein [Thermoanaerobaculia bacterium]